MQVWGNKERFDRAVKAGWLPHGEWVGERFDLDLRSGYQNGYFGLVVSQNEEDLADILTNRLIGSCVFYVLEETSDQLSDSGFVLWRRSLSVQQSGGGKVVQLPVLGAVWPLQHHAPWNDVLIQKVDQFLANPEREQRCAEKLRVICEQQLSRMNFGPFGSIELITLLEACESAVFDHASISRTLGLSSFEDVDRAVQRYREQVLYCIQDA